MEIQGATYLYTLATLMVTFAGFSALLFVIRQAAGAKLSLLDRFIVRNVMTYAFVLTAAALLPALLALFDVEEGWLWRVSSLIFALPMLSLQLSYPLRRQRIVGSAPPLPIFAVFVVLGSVTTAAMLIYILLDVRYAPGVYLAAVTLDFFTVVYGFLNALDIIMQQPVEGAGAAPGPQAPGIAPQRGLQSQVDAIEHEDDDLTLRQRGERKYTDDAVNQQRIDAIKFKTGN